MWKRFAIVLIAGVLLCGCVRGAGPVKRVVWFFPDRGLDMLDVATVGAGLGGGAAAEVHITRWASLGAGVEAGGALFWWYNRNLMPAGYYALLASFGPWHAYDFGFAGAGTAWEGGRASGGVTRLRFAGKFSPDDDPMVQRGWADPWGIGLGYAAEIHPIEIADCIAGLVSLGFWDISRDDYANPDKCRYKAGLPVD